MQQRGENKESPGFKAEISRDGIEARMEKIIIEILGGYNGIDDRRN